MKWIKEIIPYLIIIIAVILIRSFIVTPVTVSGDSMNKTLHNGQILFLNKLDKKYERFDIVVINYEKDRIIKRIIGLPGDKIEYKDNKLYVNGKFLKEDFLHEVTNDFTLKGITYDLYDKIPENYYLVLGDNRPNSYDSRMIGLIKKEDIIGTVKFRIFPFNKFGLIK